MNEYYRTTTTIYKMDVPIARDGVHCYYDAIMKYLSKSITLRKMLKDVKENPEMLLQFINNHVMREVKRNPDGSVKCEPVHTIEEMIKRSLPVIIKSQIYELYSNDLKLALYYELDQMFHNMSVKKTMYLLVLPILYNLYGEQVIDFIKEMNVPLNFYSMKFELIERMFDNVLRDVPPQTHYAYQLGYRDIYKVLQRYFKDAVKEFYNFISPQIKTLIPSEHLNKAIFAYIENGGVRHVECYRYDSDTKSYTRYEFLTNKTFTLDDKYVVDSSLTNKYTIDYLNLIGIKTDLTLFTPRKERTHYPIQ